MKIKGTRRGIEPPPRPVEESNKRWLSLAQGGYGYEGEKDTQSDPGGLVVVSASAIAAYGGAAIQGAVELVVVHGV